MISFGEVSIDEYDLAERLGEGLIVSSV